MFDEQAARPHGPVQEWTRRRDDTQEEWVPAGFWRRVFAAQVDYLVCGAVIGTVLGLGSAALPQSRFPSGIAHVMGIMALPFLYAAWAESSGRGATLGKRLLGMSVRHRDGARMSLARSFTRQVLRLATLLVMPPAFLWMALPPRKQALHDLPVGAVVVRDPRRPVQGPLAEWFPASLRGKGDMLVTALVALLAVAVTVGLLRLVVRVLLEGLARQGMPAGY